jgi:serine/threonine-protein kinase
MYVVAASFLALQCLTPYVVLWGPAEVSNLGQMVVEFDNGAMRIDSVRSDTPHAEALKAGDIVRAVGEHQIRSSRDWTVVLGNFEVGRPDDWVILRGDELITASIKPEPRTWVGVLLYIPFVGFAFGCFALGLLIAFKRPRDMVAQTGAWFILTASVALGAPGGWAVPWRQLPAVVQGFLWMPEISRFVIEAIFLSFLAVFPQRLFRSRWPWLLIWLPVLATLPWRIAGFYSVIHEFDEPALIAPAWLNQVIFARTAIYLMAGVVMMVVSYRRLVDVSVRRRYRVLVAGTTVGLAAAIAGVLVFNFVGQGTRLFVIWRTTVLPFMLACPAAFAYAILRHRVFDIDVILRQGLQYALARGAVLALVPLLGGLLILDLAVNRQQPLADILSSRGWVYGGLAILAIVAYWRRNSWLDAIDRRFFRERYNAEKVLRDVVAEIRSARNVDLVLPGVAARIESALHPEYVTVMMMKPGESEYRARISIPGGEGPQSLAADSKVVALLRVLGKPLELLFTDSLWLGRRLPLDELEFVQRARIGLLMPITLVPGQEEALLILGMKRSEEPYTHADQELLETITSSLALLLEHAPAPPAPREVSGVFKECAKCGLCYDVELEQCAVDGSKLAPVRLQRVLAHRYRLDRLLGRGGMGTVYEAKDSALGRRVAVKVIREDWVSHPEAARRFHTEARAAAGFMHPNVVTVHDYGVESQTGAYLVMELLEGGTLRDGLRERQQLNPVKIVETMRAVCSAVSAAHRRNLIHRDLKPENIFLAKRENEPGEVVKVLDFGLAKFVQLPAGTTTQITAATEAGVLLGTLAYMPPEQLLGQSPDVRWDVWALGVIAYECLTGVLPFPNVRFDEWCNALLSGNFVPLNRHFQEPSEEWRKLFSSCFAADQAVRPQSAQEFFSQVQKAFS